MPTPPPLPGHHGLRYAHFESRKSGLQTALSDRARLDDARRQAADWVDTHPGIDIVSIECCFGQILAVVTVWYRGPLPESAPTSRPPVTRIPSAILPTLPAPPPPLRKPPPIP